ncbi:hypothetical protein V1294_006737 [Bradyrhizobium sp. AZCC 1678]|uniref:hypothetical protein n=1 Tax=Bradyrhizobium sp. AZCC 1678 TaxID=3117030 RepID=UPI002FF2035F
MAPKSQRKEITQAVVDEALARASRAKDSKEIHDYFDTTQRYLQLRQRGRSVSWFVRAKGQSRRIGSASQAPGDREFLSLKAARRKAGEVFFAMKPRSALNLSGRSGWTWAELDRQYQASLKLLRKKGKKIKRPSKGTQDDVRLCFGKPEFVGWRKIRLADLTDLNLIKLIGEVHTARGHRACEKTLAYVKAALSWAHSEQTIESGLAGAMPWWAAIKPPQPKSDEIGQMETRQRTLVAAKNDFTVENLGDLLARHERFCADRAGNERISPAVRWGVWWFALTANRRFTLSQLRRDDLQPIDPLNPYSSPDQPWGIAEWPAEAVKNKVPFMLPVPPIGLHVANSCMWDWRLLVGKKRGFRSATEWLFASTRRRSRRDHPDNPDPGLYPNSLNAHLRAMRGKKKNGMNRIDYLKGLPPVWPHLVRSVATNFFARHRRTLPAAAASAMLGHVLPNDNDVDWRRMSKTTEDYYLTAQHMDLKAEAMKLWSEALVKAYVEAGGMLPMPREQAPLATGPTWILPRLPKAKSWPRAA